MPVLNQVLSIKVLRSDKAEQALVRQRAMLTQACVLKQRLEQALEDFRMKAQAEERRLYLGLCGTVVQVRDLDRVRERVVMMRDEELMCERRVADAEDQIERANAALEECRRLQRKTSIELDSMRGLVLEFDADQSYEREYREEMELEDRFAPHTSAQRSDDQGETK